MNLPSAIVPPYPMPHPTSIHSFTSTKLDALVLVEAVLSGRLSLCPPGTICGESFIASGFLFVYEHSAPELGDRTNWIFVDFDDPFKISRSADSDGLLKREISVKVDETVYHLVCYYAQWDTVNGVLISPTRCLDFKDIVLRDELATHKDLRFLSPMEKFRLNVETLGRDQFEFMKNVAFLTFSWTDEIHHQALCQRSRQLLFPIIPSSEEYWYALSTSALFEGKTSHQLAYQMETLLSMLLWVSCGKDIPQFLKPSPEFTPLQNVGIYMEAFGVQEKPVEAFQPLNIAKLARSLKQSRLFAESENINIQDIESWNNNMQYSLPINCPRNNLVLTPAFTITLSCMSIADQEAVRMGLEQNCEVFPSFRSPDHRELVLLDQCYHSSKDAEVETVLRNWTNTKDGERARLRVLNVFQKALAPEELALTLANMLTLWCLNPPTEAVTSQPNLVGLAELLYKPDTLEESHVLLLALFRSFRYAVKSLDEKTSIPIMQFLHRNACGDEDLPPSEDLYVYFIRRLDGKSHDDAMPLDKLVEQLSLFE